MNITAGTPFELGKGLESIRPKDYLANLMQKGFSGYACVAVHGKMGLEEGVLVFHSGSIVSSEYNYFYFNKSFKAEQGLEKSLNAFLSSAGILDAFSLTSSQVQLVLTLNEENNLKTQITPANLSFPVSFSYSYEDELRKEKPEEEEVTKEEMLKRLGLTRLVGSKTTRGELVKKAKEDVWKEMGDEE